MAQFAAQLSGQTAPNADLQPLACVQAWYGPEMAHQQADWLYCLSSAEVAELRGAIGGVEALGLDVVDVHAKDFPLPLLQPRLQAMRKDLHEGRSFTVLRGFPVEELTPLQRATGFFGIGAHLGEAVSQNAGGHALGHVADLGFDYSQPTSRGYQTTARLPYHSDASDVAGLLCVRTSKSGGQSSIVSSVTLYNEMLRQRPDLVRVLMQPFYCDRRDEIPEGMGPWYTLPVFKPHDGRMITTYVRSSIRKAQRFSEVPRISPEQEEAMNLLDALAEDPRLHLDMELAPGDIQLVNNHFILHSRTTFEDYPEPERRRHLLRLWLACQDGPPLPEVYGNYQPLTAGGRPNGYHVPEVPLNAPLTPEDGGPGSSQQRLGGESVPS